MIELISPVETSKEVELIKNLRDFGMDYLDINSVIGWNYVLDHVWLYRQIEKYLDDSKLMRPVIMDVGCGNSPFHNFVEEKLKVNVVGIDRPAGYCHQEKLMNADHLVEFLTFDIYPEETVDIIYWLSAIEHNQKEMIGKLYEKSWRMLKPGGLLLVTFPVSKKTEWFEPSQQTNLSLDDASELFDERNVVGDLNDIKSEFRKNTLMLKDKYQKRYEQFTEEDPEFVVGGLLKIK